MDQYPNPAIVGKVFVKQYYTQMHRDPSQLHRFYLDESSYVHGGSDIGSEEPVIGQQAIHDKIKSLDLSSVHAKIKQVDSHATLGNGIVIQVTGELSIGGKAMRAFVQTFILAPESPKKYYVHNDIFRYQDDDESGTSDGPGDSECNVLTDTSVENAEYQPVTSDPSADLVNPDVGDTGLYTPQSAELGNVVEQSETMEMGGAGGGTSSSWDQYGEQPHHVEVKQNGISDDVMEATPQTPGDYSLQVESSDHVSTEQLEQERGMEEFGGGELQEVESKGGSTWASRIAGKQGSQQSAQGRPLNSTIVSGSQALPQREPQSQRRGEPTSKPLPSAMLTAKDTSKKGPPILSARDAPDTWQIFVGGLPQHTTEAEIRSIFSQFGTILEVRVNQKNFAFIVFDNAESVTSIIGTKESLQIRNKFLNIEPKRPSAPRLGGGGSRGDRDRDRERNKLSGGGPGGERGGAMSGRTRGGKGKR